MHTRLDNYIPSFRVIDLIIREKKGSILHVAKTNNEIRKLK